MFIILINSKNMYKCYILYVYRKHSYMYRCHIHNGVTVLVAGFTMGNHQTDDVILDAVLLEGHEQVPLGLGVEGAGGFVEEQNLATPLAKDTRCICPPESSLILSSASRKSIWAIRMASWILSRGMSVMS